MSIGLRAASFDYQAVHRRESIGQSKSPGSSLRGFALNQLSTGCGPSNQFHRYAIQGRCQHLFSEWPCRRRQSRTAMADEPLVGLTDQVQYPLATPSKPPRHKNPTLKID